MRTYACVPFLHLGPRARAGARFDPGRAGDRPVHQRPSPGHLRGGVRRLPRHSAGSRLLPDRPSGEVVARRARSALLRVVRGSERESSGNRNSSPRKEAKDRLKGSRVDFPRFVSAGTTRYQDVHVGTPSCGRMPRRHVDPLCVRGLAATRRRGRGLRDRELHWKRVDRCHPADQLLHLVDRPVASLGRARAVDRDGAVAVADVHRRHPAHMAGPGPRHLGRGRSGRFRRLAGKERARLASDRVPGASAPIPADRDDGHTAGGSRQLSQRPPPSPGLSGTDPTYRPVGDLSAPRQRHLRNPTGRRDSRQARAHAAAANPSYRSRRQSRSLGAIPLADNRRRCAARWTDAQGAAKPDSPGHADVGRQARVRRSRAGVPSRRQSGKPRDVPLAPSGRDLRRGPARLGAFQRGVFDAATRRVGSLPRR